MKKLASLSVRKLFGIFDYDINFEDFGGFTILTAPNGYGKSTILKIIQAAAAGNFCYFAGLPFDSIALSLLDSSDTVNDKGDGSILRKEYTELRVEKTKRNVKKSKSDAPSLPLKDLEVAPAVIADVEDEGVPGEDCHFQCTASIGDWTFSFNDDDIENTVIPLIQNMGDYERIYANSSNHRNFWVDARDSSVLDLAGIFVRSPLFFRRRFPKVAEWIQKVGLNCTYIGTDRLYMDGGNSVRRRFTGDNPERRFERVNVRSLQVSEICHDISSAHFRCMRQYLEKSRKLEGSFVTRVIDSLGDNSDKVNALRKSVKVKLAKIQEMEKRCAEYGIVAKSVEEKLKKTDAENALVVLDMFLDDVIEKLHIYDDLLERLDEMKTSLSELLEMKTVEICIQDDDELPVASKQEFAVRNRITGENIPLGALSSGEQHLIVLLGKLLFGTRGAGFAGRRNLLDHGADTALVLIDEPELSFHPGWQESFGKVLDRIRTRYNVEFVAATHSPSFIGKRWENTVELADQAPAVEG